jgi:AcrR family transcriptional regulator
MNNRRAYTLRRKSAATRARLLEAAEALYAERGYDAVPVREVTRRARANLAAVGYHFGSKERLFIAALTARARPLNARRVSELDSLQAGGRTPALRAVLDAFSRTLVEGAVSGTPQGARLHRLVSRAFAESDVVARHLFREEMMPVALRFLGAVCEACPGLPRAQAGLGLALFAGSVLHAMRWAVDPPIPALGAKHGPPGVDRLMETLLDFGEAGFRALDAGGAGATGRRR